MAKTRALTRFAPRPSIVVVSPARGKAARRPSRFMSRRSARGGRKGHSPKSISTALAFPVALGGAVVGWAGAKGYLSKLPAIGGSRMTTLGLAGFAAMKWAKSKTVRAAGLAALAAAAFDFGRTQGGGTPLAGYDLDGEDVEGDGDVEGEDTVY